MLSRRQFFQKSGHGALSLAIAVATGEASFTLTGCSFGDVLTNLEKYVPIALQAFAGVVTLLNPTAGSVLSIAITAAKALWTDLQAILAAYNAAPSADKTTLLGKVNTALLALLASLNQTLSDAHVTNTQDAETATVALTLLVVTLESIQAQLPTSAVAVAAARTVKPVATMRTVTLRGGSITLDPNPRKFKPQYNAIVVKGGHSELQLH